MSTKHRHLRREATARQQVDKHCLRDLASLRATGRGPYAPGPWWPVGDKRYLSVEEWEKETSRE